MALMLTGALQLSCTAKSADYTELPAPAKTTGQPLMQVLNERHTERNFLENKEISSQITSNLLWAACGVNREDGRRTIPTAVNRQDLEVYAARADGLWRYDAVNNKLVLVKSGDARRGRFKTAPLIFYYVGKDDNFGYMHAGSAYQNAGLYCASAGLANVVVGGPDTIEGANGLTDFGEKKVLVAQAFGWPKSDVKFTPDKLGPLRGRPASGK